MCNDCVLDLIIPQAALRQVTQEVVVHNLMTSQINKQSHMDITNLTPYLELAREDTSGVDVGDSARSYATPANFPRRVADPPPP